MHGSGPSESESYGMRYMADSLLVRTEAKPAMLPSTLKHAQRLLVCLEPTHSHHRLHLQPDPASLPWPLSSGIYSLVSWARLPGLHLKTRLCQIVANG